MLNNFCAALGRKKPLTDEESRLARVLNLLDLTALGVGSTLGVGIYVLAGAVAKNEAGPAACLSFLVAAIASAIAGICYAEFASRVPKAGSAYVYCYVTVGEFSAFIIGWNLILEYVIGTASVARALSNYIDALVGNVMQEKLTALMPINVGFMSPYPDFLSFAFVCVLTLLLIVGVKESTFLNNIFTALNLCTVATVMVVGIININVDNWKIPKEEIPPQFTNAGEGGFLPFGVAGVMAGAAKCFYGYVGFDCVATTSEEAKNPKKNIPLAICFSLLIIFCSYFGMSVVLTLMWPYYDQDPKAPFPYILEQLNYPTIKLIVTGGAIFALCTSMLGGMFPLPRVIYAMADDGLFFHLFSNVNERTKTPAKATILAGLLSGIMAALFDLDQLINMMSIGTLLAYTIVAICVLILRYVPVEKEYFHGSNDTLSMKQFSRNVLNIHNVKEPSRQTSTITNVTLLIYCILACFFCGVIIYYLDFSDGGSITVFSLLLLGLLLSTAVIYRQPKAIEDLTFKVPFVPLIPLLSIVFNIYLMLELDLQTWIRFIVWLIIGFAIYFGYGIRHSKVPSVPPAPTAMKTIQNAPSVDTFTGSTTTIVSNDTVLSELSNHRQRHQSVKQ